MCPNALPAEDPSRLPRLRLRDVSGAVLAGGRSTRMGRDKASLELAGETLLARQIRVLREAGIRDVLVSVRRDQACADRDVSVVYDAREGRGPLAGIVAAMERAAERHLLVLAVDMPGVDGNLLGALFREAVPGLGRIPRVGDRWEPLCGLYPPRTLDVARRHLDTPPYSPSALADELFAAGRLSAHPLGPEDALRLASVNRPEDLGAEGAGRS